MAVTKTSSTIMDWALRLIPVLILAMAIPPKFSADPGAVAMFTQLGAEPFGRIATGVFESVAVLLLLLPGTVIYGALLTAGLMSGAILSHIVVLGISVDGDPTMFLMGLVAFCCALALVWRRRCQIPLMSQFVRSCEVPTS